MWSAAVAVPCSSGSHLLTAAAGGAQHVGAVVRADQHRVERLASVISQTRSMRSMFLALHGAQLAHREQLLLAGLQRRRRADRSA
jgi:hypothetical protein